MIDRAGKAEQAKEQERLWLKPEAVFICTETILKNARNKQAQISKEEKGDGYYKFE